MSFPPRGDAADHDDGLAPLDDPYLRLPPPSPRAETSALAITSVAVALLLGPVGAVAAVVFGWAALREIRDPGARRTGGGLATLGIVLGALLLPAWGGAFVYWMGSFRNQAEQLADRSPTSSPEPARSPVDPSPDPPASPTPSDPPRGGTVPKTTLVHHEGAITVVDVGVSASSLEAELAKQRAEASSLGEKLLVMITRDPCDPCRGVDRSLGHPLMQTALAKVRLVRIDIDVFDDDLDKLRMPHQAWPGFFTLSVDLTPKDGIDGGEWDDNVAQNIAPVLGAFVRGKYGTRRKGWQPLPGSGMRL